MARRVTDEDLLALVEGTLAEERVEAVRSALRSDRALLERVQGMARDRGLLKELAERRIPAPDDLIESAIAGAEREALTGGASARRAPRYSWRAVAVAASIAVAFLGVWAGTMWLLVWDEPAPAPGSGAASVAMVEGGGREPAREPGPGPRLGEVESLPGLGLAGGEPPVEAFEEAASSGAEGPDADELLEQFLASMDERSGSPAEALAGAEAVGLDRAVELLREGRLAIRLEPGWVGPGAVASASGAMAGPSVPAEAPGRLTLEMAPSAGDGEVRAALERAIRRLELTTWSRVSLVDAGGSGSAPGSSWSLEAGDVVWWESRPSVWGAARARYEAPIVSAPAR